jgi:hypothetical protein
VPRCALHPDIETSLRCMECDRYICPKDMVSTPVGYKCRECARPAHTQLGGAKPLQYARGAGFGLAAALGGGLLLAFVPLRFGLFGFLAAALFGALVAEATRRGSGGHRTPPFAAMAGVFAFLGGAIGRFGLIGIVIAVVAAVFSLLGNRF